MNEPNENENERYFTLFEQECLDEIKNEPDLGKELIERKELSGNRLWSLFQAAATSIAQLYRDRQSDVLLWVPFQNAAGDVTALYKECGDSQKNLTDTGVRTGYQRRNKELISWVKKRKKLLKREDLIGFLTGRMPPHPRSRPRLNLDSIRTSSHPFYSHIALPHQELEANNIVNSEHEFRETLPNFPCSLPNIRQQNSSHLNHNLVGSFGDFITEDYSQNVESLKRSSSSDVIMDSPTHKRSRFK